MREARGGPGELEVRGSKGRRRTAAAARVRRRLVARARARAGSRAREGRAQSREQQRGIEVAHRHHASGCRAGTSARRSRARARGRSRRRSGRARGSARGRGATGRPRRRRRRRARGRASPRARRISSSTTSISRSISVRVEARVQHRVRQHVDADRRARARQGRVVDGDVEGGVGVDASAGALDLAGDLARRRAARVPLKSMCSWKWARPASPGRSSAEPDVGPDLDLGDRREPGRAAAPSGPVRQRSRGGFGGLRRGRGYPSPGGRIAAPVTRLSRWRRDRRRLRPRPLLRAGLPLLRLRGGGGARLGRGAERRYVDALLRELERGAATTSPGGASRACTSAAARRRCCGPSRSRGSSRRCAAALPSGAPGRGHPRGEPQHGRARAAARLSRGRREPLSLGVQSFDDAVLKRLGRAHRADEARAHPRRRRAAGFAALSLDLIFAAPGQTLALLRSATSTSVAFGPEHVSAYALTVEPGTPFARAVARGQLALPDEDEAAAMLEAAEALAGSRPRALRDLQLRAAGLRVRPQPPLLGAPAGAGPRASAPGRATAARRGRPTACAARTGATLARLPPLARGEPAAEAGPAEVLDAATARGEAAFLALRTRRGLMAAGSRRSSGFRPAALLRRGDRGAARRGPAGGGARRRPAATPRGRLLADTVFEAFVGGRGAGR